MGHATPQPNHWPEQPAPAFTIPVVFESARQAHYTYRTVPIARRLAKQLREEQLNALGQDGWLLVSVLSRTDADGQQYLDHLFVRREA